MQAPETIIVEKNQVSCDGKAGVSGHPLVYLTLHADGQISLFEYCLACLLHRQLTESLDPTANWQTYIGREYGFEFKYPVLQSPPAGQERSPRSAQYQAGEGLNDGSCQLARGHRNARASAAKPLQPLFAINSYIRAAERRLRAGRLVVSTVVISSSSPGPSCGRDTSPVRPTASAYFK